MVEFDGIIVIIGTAESLVTDSMMGADDDLDGEEQRTAAGASTVWVEEIMTVVFISPVVIDGKTFWAISEHALDCPSSCSVDATET